MYAIRYEVGRRTYERAGFETEGEARRFIMERTSAATWTIYRVDAAGCWHPC